MNLHINPTALANAIVGSQPQHQPNNPELARMPLRKEKLVGLSRSYLYSLEKAGLIKTISLTFPGKKRGVKLVDVASLRAWISSNSSKS